MRFVEVTLNNAKRYLDVAAVSITRINIYIYI